MKIFSALNKINLLALVMLPLLIIGFAFTVLGKIIRVCNVLVFLFVFGVFNIIIWFLVRMAMPYDIIESMLVALGFTAIVCVITLVFARLYLLGLRAIIPFFRKFSGRAFMDTFGWIGEKVEEFGIGIVHRTSNKCMNMMYEIALGIEEDKRS